MKWIENGHKSLEGTCAAFLSMCIGAGKLFIVHDKPLHIHIEIV